jgi:hypothetical protein
VFKTTLLTAALLTLASSAHAQLANLKVVTDANPDYTDMESMTQSITKNWKTDQEKMWALFYWAHIGRRHSGPVHYNGFDVTDPIRQFNDYGFAFFQTNAGLNNSTWNYMGYPSRATGLYSEVWYDDAFHLYDNNFSMIYSLPDGKTIAGSRDLAKPMAGPETDGKPVPGYLVLYHALTGTGPRSWPQGGDYEHSLQDLVQNFGTDIQPLYLHNRGHRYILNLRKGEIYTRYYKRQDETSAHAIILDHEQSEYKADPAAFVHQGLNAAEMPADPEANAPRFRVRGTGERTFTPILDAANLPAATYSTTNIKALSPGLQAAQPGKPAEAVFKVEGSNVITSFKLRALANVATPEDSVTISLSADKGATWKEIWKTTKPGDNAADQQFIKEVNGLYDFLIKVTLAPKTNAEDAQLKFIGFNAWTEINSKTQPKLNLGANTVYVGAGDPSNTIVVEPDLRAGRYKPYLIEEKNIRISEENFSRFPILHPAENTQPAHLIFKADAPTDIISFTYGGRFSLGHGTKPITLSHSIDGGKTWIDDHTIDPSARDVRLKADVMRYHQSTTVPANTRSILFKYTLNRGEGESLNNANAIYNVRMEVNHKLQDPTPQPVEVTFRWRELQQDRSWKKRSHTQLVEKLPATYPINVGGFDHPKVDSLTISLKGTRSDPAYGYSDGIDSGGEKWNGRWETIGKNLAHKKKYTLSVPSGDNWGAGDPKLTKLTDGVVGHSFSGGNAYGNGPIWAEGTKPEVVIDLGESQKCGAFRMHIVGYPSWDAITGNIKDRVEVQTSADGKEYTSAGFFNFKLFKKDIPLNFMVPDTEELVAYNFTLPLKAPVEARFIKYKITPARMLGVTELQVLDSYTLTPFNLNIALPDPTQNGKLSPKPDLSPNAKTWQPDELPTVAEEFPPNENPNPRNRPRRNRPPR